MTAFGADQFEEKDPNEAKALASFFNWLLLSSTLGAITGVTGVVWVSTQRAWHWGFFIITIASSIGFVTLALGAEVMLECKQRNNNEVVFSKPGKTDATGEYTIYVDQDRADEVCDVKLINTPERSCSERAPGRDQARVILTRYNSIASNDRFANAMLYMAEEVASGCAEVLKQMLELDEENYLINS